jgi:hypothetical protein
VSGQALRGGSDAPAGSRLDPLLQHPLDQNSQAYSCTHVHSSICTISLCTQLPLLLTRPPHAPPACLPDWPPPSCSHPACTHLLSSGLDPLRDALLLRALPGGGAATYLHDFMALLTAPANTAAGSAAEELWLTAGRQRQPVLASPALPGHTQQRLPARMTRQLPTAKMNLPPRPPAASRVWVSCWCRGACSRHANDASSGDQGRARGVSWPPKQHQPGPVLRSAAVCWAAGWQGASSNASRRGVQEGRASAAPHSLPEAHVLGLGGQVQHAACSVRSTQHPAWILKLNSPVSEQDWTGAPSSLPVPFSLKFVKFPVNSFVRVIFCKLLQHNWLACLARRSPQGIAAAAGGDQCGCYAAGPPAEATRCSSGTKPKFKNMLRGAVPAGRQTPAATAAAAAVVWLYTAACSAGEPWQTRDRCRGQEQASPPPAAAAGTYPPAT